VAVLLVFENALDDDVAFLTGHLLERFRQQGIQFEDIEGSWIYAGEEFTASVSAADGTVSALLMSTNRPEVAKPSGSERSEYTFGISPREAQSLVKKSKQYFKKHYSDNIRLQSVYTAHRVEYARFGKAVVYSEATLDERFAVVKYSRTRHGCGMWAWRFVRATEILDEAPDVIVAVEVWSMSECPLKVRNFESHMYWSSGLDLWSYTDPAEYVNWWSYISFILFQYPLEATVYFSPYHPGVLDEYNEYYGTGIYSFTQESIEHAGVVGLVNL